MDGVLLIDKPAGMSSHDVVAAVKRTLGGDAKVGHAGTLDPFATGLLIVLIGRATKSQVRLMALPKRYETVARLGASSTTGDTEGEIAYTGRLPPNPPLLPTGQIAQRPPRYSAVKVGGERAYKRARRGERFELPERIVTVYRFEQLWRAREEPEPELEKEREGERSVERESVETSACADTAELGETSGNARVGDTDRQLERAGYEIECSSGTYVRSLIADHLSDAYCLELRRTAIGPFAVSEAITPPRRAERWRDPPPPPSSLMPIEQALARLPA